MNNVYVEFFKKSFRRSFIYRADSYLTAVGSVITLLIQASLWTALLKNSASAGGINSYDMYGYILINTIVMSLTRTDIGSALADKVGDGSIAVDFIRPVKLKYYLFFDDMGQSLFRTIFCVLPICLAAVFFLKIRMPQNLSIGRLF